MIEPPIRSKPVFKRCSASVRQPHLQFGLVKSTIPPTKKRTPNPLELDVRLFMLLDPFLSAFLEYCFRA